MCFLYLAGNGHQYYYHDDLDLNTLVYSEQNFLDPTFYQNTIHQVNYNNSNYTVEPVGCDFLDLTNNNASVNPLDNSTDPLFNDLFCADTDTFIDKVLNNCTESDMERPMYGEDIEYSVSSENDYCGITNTASAIQQIVNTDIPKMSQIAANDNVSITFQTSPKGTTVKFIVSVYISCIFKINNFKYFISQKVSIIFKTRSY